MRHSLLLSLAGSTLFLGLAATSGQAAVPGLHSAVPSAAQGSVVSKARWWGHRRHCWWHHHHCR
jgi:hypothetical protein